MLRVRERERDARIWYSFTHLCQTSRSFTANDVADGWAVGVEVCAVRGEVRKAWDAQSAGGTSLK